MVAVVLPVSLSPQNWKPPPRGPRTNLRLGPVNARLTANMSRELPVQRASIFLFQSSRVPLERYLASIWGGRSPKSVSKRGLGEPTISSGRTMAPLFHPNLVATLNVEGVCC